MPQITQTETRIDITETTSTTVRVVIFFLGLLPLLAPYELLIKPGWSGINLFSVLFLLISLGAVGVSVAFVGGALFGVNQTLTFERPSRTITHAYASPVFPLRVKTYAFQDLRKIEMITHEWDNGPDTYGLKFTFADGRKTEPGTLSPLEEAARLKATLDLWCLGGRETIRG